MWLFTLLLLLYLLLAYMFSFFGEINFDLRVFTWSATAREMFLRQTIVGFVEETLFRGIILYGLVRVWGKTMEGVIKSVMVQAALFGGIHFLQGLVAFSLQTAVLNIANGFISGVWWGAMRYHWRSLWPVILLHGLSNLVVQVNGLTTPTIEPAVLAYGRAALLELPLMVWGMWLLWRGTVQGE